MEILIEILEILIEILGSPRRILIEILGNPRNPERNPREILANPMVASLAPLARLRGPPLAQEAEPDSPAALEAGKVCRRAGRLGTPRSP